MAYWKSTDKLHRQPDSHAKPPSERFFKVILGDALQAKKMTIPSVFVNDFGNELKDEANLIVANGHVWKVGLTKSQNTLAFDRNWDGFAEHYSLQHGHFLLFKYKGSSNFKVRIFDKSCSEITYPCYEPNYKEMGDETETTSSKKRTKKWDCSNRPATLKKNQETSKRLKRAASPEVANDKTSEAQGGEFEEKFEVGFGKAPPECESVIGDARKFKSKFPNFKVLLLNFNFSRYFMYVSPGFASKYMREKPESVILELSDDGRQWSVNVNQRSNGRITFGKGWVHFYRENNLKKGDICVFEFMRQYVFRVSIIRVLYLNSLMMEDNGALMSIKDRMDV